MALGRSQVQQRFENPREILGDRLKEGSIYRLLADHGHQLKGTKISISPLNWDDVRSTWPGATRVGTTRRLSEGGLTVVG